MAVGRRGEEQWRARGARTECPLPNARGEGGEPEALIVRSFVIDETQTCDEPSGRYFEYFNGRFGFVLARDVKWGLGPPATTGRRAQSQECC